MRLQQIIGIAGLGALLVFGGACGQESTSSKPVVKRIAKGKRTASARKQAVKEKTSSKKQPGVRRAARRAAKRTPSAQRAQRPHPTPSKQEVAYVYAARARPDPFRPFFEAAEKVASACEDMVPGPLTERDVSRFTLVAVVKRGKESVAMVQDTEGKGYVLRMGTYVGKKCGKVAQIDEEGVIVEEPYQDLLGQNKTRRVSLAFKASEGGGP